MQALFTFLHANPYMLLFLVVSLAVLIGRFTLKGYGLGTVGGAIVVGCGVAIAASLHGITLKLDTFTMNLFYYLFMYGVGLRVGPSFLNSLKDDGLKFTLLAVICSLLSLAVVVLGARLLNLPTGVAGGTLAGATTMSSAIGSAEQAVASGAVKLAAGETVEGVSAMITLSYGITYLWGTIGIVLMCKYMPRWWGVDAKAAARRYEEQHGMHDVDDDGLTANKAFGLRAYRLENPATIGLSIREFIARFPEYRIVDVHRSDESIGADPETRLQAGDVISLGSTRTGLTSNIGLIGPEVDDAKALAVPLDHAEILVTEKTVIGKQLKEFRGLDLAGQLQLTRLQRGGVPLPVGPETRLQRRDVLFVTGLSAAVQRAGELFGVIARPSSMTDLLTLFVGMTLGLLIGLIQFPAFGASVGLGSAGGLMVSGIIISSLSSRLRFFGNTPNAARNILEDVGLLVFVAIVGINAGATLLAQLTGSLAVQIFLLGFVACMLPPFAVWVVGYHLMKINPAVLMGGMAGARSHSGPCQEAATEIGSNVPWVGFPVAFAVSGVLLTVFGYFAMTLAD
ncbi:transporter [Pseudomonas sp. WJP1]|uniref:aspartate:alanine exchanger family transporter n=1 Tax=Pseudomonas sp. WJP1 TaxID=2986947 RepID=UPI00234A8327|nr:TrkA C-terminal domain-containing protein [Pseudomonas sp. WJP1]WCM53258.1 transporter [Pseudomonas sp. WJP1]